jgi:GNAT superfamily N-acetyltransferase
MPKITIETKIGPAKRAILKGLMAFNRSKLGKVRNQQVVVALREGDKVVGGAVGSMFGPTLFIDLLWIDERFRGQDHGTRTMQAMEAEGRRLGAQQVYLDTIEFQARPFYEKLGYTVFGTLDNFVAGGGRYWLRKDLV